MATSSRKRPSFDPPTPTAAGAEWVPRPAGNRTSKARGATANAAKAAAPPRVEQTPPADHQPVTAAAAVAVASTPRSVEAEQIVQRYARYAAATGLIPLPVVDMAALTALQLSMLQTLAECYAVPFSRERGRVVLTSVVGGVMPSLAGHEVLVHLARHLTAVSGFSVAATVSVGRLFASHFEAGGTFETIDLEQRRRQMSDAMAGAAARR